MRKESIILLLSLLFLGVPARAQEETAIPARESSRVATPTLLGLARSQAVIQVEKAGLRPVVLESYSDRPVGTVLSQSPPADVHLEPGSRVQLVVSRGAAPPSSSPYRAPERKKESGREGGLWWLLFQLPLAFMAWWAWRRVRNLQ